jgi:hypothetical protein
MCSTPRSRIVKENPRQALQSLATIAPPTQLEPNVHRPALTKPAIIGGRTLPATLQAAFACPHRGTFRQDYNFHNLDCGFSGGTTDGTSNV